MVTPSACSTTLIRTSAGSLLRPRFTATTSTSFPPPDASIDPFTPTISIVLPPARAPCQRNSLPCWAWGGEPVRPARASSVGASIVGVSGIAGRWPYGGPDGRDSHGALDTEAGRRVGSIFPAMSTLAPATIRAPTGTALSCKGWHQEAALRMLMNNLDPAVAERRGERQGGAERGLLREDRGDAAAPRERRDAAGAERQAGRGLPHPRRGAPGADRQRAPGAALGHLG